MENRVLKIDITSGTNWFEVSNEINHRYNPVRYDEIWLNFATESWFSIDNLQIKDSIYKYFEDVIEDTEIPYNKFKFIHGNVYTKENYDVYCNIFQVPMDKRYNCEYHPYWHFVTHRTHYDYSYQMDKNKDRIRPKHFSCFNGAPRDHRILTYNFLNNNPELKEKGRNTFFWADEYLPYTEFRYKRRDDENNWRLIHSHSVQEPEFYQAIDDSYFDFITETLTTHERFTIELEDHVINPIDIRNKHLYEQMQTIFITEKTWRSVYYKRPFILMGNYGTLNYLKQLGYKTFEHLWSEDYDIIGNNDIRVDSTLNILKHFCERNTLEQLHDKIYSDQTQSILEHNYNLFCSQAEEIFNL